MSERLFWAISHLKANNRRAVVPEAYRGRRELPDRRFWAIPNFPHTNIWFAVAIETYREKREKGGTSIFWAISTVNTPP